MSIVNFNTRHLLACKDIDIKSYLWPWLDEGWGKIQGYIIRVFIKEDRVIGFCSFRPEENSIRISKLCVHPDYREQGVGSKLYNDLIRMAKKYNKKKIVMMLHQDNEYRNFIIRRGWRAVSVSGELFPDSTDGYLFVKEIS